MEAEDVEFATVMGKSYAHRATQIDFCGADDATYRFRVALVPFSLGDLWGDLADVSKDSNAFTVFGRAMATIVDAAEMAITF